MQKGCSLKFHGAIHTLTLHHQCIDISLNGMNYERWKQNLYLTDWPSQLKMLLQNIYPTILCQSGRGASLHGMHGCNRGMQLMWLP